MKNKNLKESKGITLIALVITIIVLLILVAVSIATLTGENGILTKAQTAKGETEEAQKEEENELDRAQAVLSEYNGAAEGKKDSSKNRTLSGKTELAEYTYKNPVIPEGFIAVDDGAGWYYVDEEQTEVKGWNDGLVIEDLEGNQFVWVPVDEEKVIYEKRDWEGSTYKISETKVETSAYPEGIEDEKAQINKYHGFYVARFEAGKEDAVNESVNQTESAQNNIIGKPLSKYGTRVWNYVTWNNALNSAKLMENTDNVKSGLITGTQWDTICSWYKNSGIIVEGNESNWGTYPNLDYSGNGEYFDFPLGKDTNANHINPWMSGSFNHILGDLEHRYFHATGLNKNGYQKNIADMAGNFAEFTNELKDTGTFYYRGWCAFDSSTCSSRLTNYTRGTFGGVSFRVALFIM